MTADRISELVAAGESETKVVLARAPMTGSYRNA